MGKTMTPLGTRVFIEMVTNQKLDAGTGKPTGDLLFPETTDDDGTVVTSRENHANWLFNIGGEHGVTLGNPKQTKKNFVAKWKDLYNIQPGDPPKTSDLNGLASLISAFNKCNSVWSYPRPDSDPATLNYNLYYAFAQIIAAAYDRGQQAGPSSGSTSERLPILTEESPQFY